MAPSADADQELLLAAADRDGAAFEAFFRRHVDAVLAFFAHRVDDRETAADLTAETFAAALVGLRRFKRRPEPATSWLFAIARNKLRDHHRRRTVRRSALRRLRIERYQLDDADLERIEQLAERDETRRRLIEGLDELPEPQRRAVVARVVQERPYRDIADDFGETEAVIRQRVSRGLRSMRERLEHP